MSLFITKNTVPPTNNNTANIAPMTFLSNFRFFKDGSVMTVGELSSTSMILSTFLLIFDWIISATKTSESSISDGKFIDFLSASINFLTVDFGVFCKINSSIFLLISFSATFMTSSSSSIRINSSISSFVELYNYFNIL